MTAGKTFRASFTRGAALVYLALKWVSTSFRTFAFLATSAASMHVLCFLTTALSPSLPLKVESKIRRSQPEKKRASRGEGRVSPE